jgi:LacI family transcriptional regulator
MPKPNVKMLDVARHAGLSRATVSLAFKNSPLLREDTRKQVIEAARTLGYIYNRNAANLRRTRSDMIGMIINDLTNPFFAELAVGCERVLQSTGHVVVLANTDEQVDRQATVLGRMREQGVAGIIICAARGTPANAFRDLIDAGIPVVEAMPRRCCPTIAQAQKQPCCILRTMATTALHLPAGLMTLRCCATALAVITTVWRKRV